MKNVVLWDAKDVNYAVIARVDDKNEVHEFVCAYGYNETDGTWEQGHYFNSLLTAISYMRGIYSEDFFSYESWSKVNRWLPDDWSTGVNERLEMIRAILCDIGDNPVEDDTIAISAIRLGYCD